MKIWGKVPVQTVKLMIKTKEKNCGDYFEMKISVIIKINCICNKTLLTERKPMKKVEIRKFKKRQLHKWQKLKEVQIKTSKLRLKTLIKQDCLQLEITKKY